MRCVQFALALALAAVTASGQDWRGELDMIDNDLRTQHYAHARKWSIKMINSMSDHLGTGPDAMYTLALTVVYRAMAEEGLQKQDDADWYWHVAMALYPKFAKHDWSPYGEVGEWVATHKHTDPLQANEADRSPPVALRKAEAKCPLSAIQGAYFQPVTVAAIIDGDGAARCPRLISRTEAPTLVYAAFESLKQWQFQPGSVEGKPLPMTYEVTINFKPPRS
jgi:TonB-like protein